MCQYPSTLEWAVQTSLDASLALLEVRPEHACGGGPMVSAMELSVISVTGNLADGLEELHVRIETDLIRSEQFGFYNKLAQINANKNDLKAF
jgi:hypothetical protein